MDISRRGLLKLTARALGVLALPTIYAVGIEPTWLRTVRHDAKIPGLDPSLDGLRIVQLSDFHIGAGVPFDYLTRAVEDAMALEPDVAVVTGDFLHDGKVEGLQRLPALLSRLHAPLGVYGVLGNHDFGSPYGRRSGPDVPAVARLRTALGDGGLRLLHNEATLIAPPRGGRLRLAGYADLWSGAFFPDAIEFGGGIPTVALSHNPDTAPELADRGASLILSGHTHGGQVCVPFLGPPILPVERREYAAGPYDLGATRLYVNRGVGWLSRVRLFVRPEVTLHTLRA